MDINQSFKYCRNIVKSNYENFPVGLFVPRKIKKYVYSIYAFARTADNFADTEETLPQVKLQQLSDWEIRLRNCYEDLIDHPIFIALKATIDKFNIFS